MLADWAVLNATNFRDNVMPDSPDSKHSSQPPVPPLSLNMSSVTAGSRPLSTSSSISGINGSHSPLSGINGRTPSPPSVGSMMNAAIGQQLPPACGARQLSKLKRFLTTLQQFGSDISPEIGDRVRTLVLGLVNSHLSIEEFHAKLQEATNFPLRPFVIPFLKANLPLLQRELLHCARMAKQTPQQFLTQNEHIVFDPAHSPLESQDSVTSDLNENGKRRASPESRPKENGSVDSLMSEPLHPAKRHHPNSPVGSRISPNGSMNLGSGAPIRLEDISLSREMRERERERVERERAERERAAERDRERDRHYSGNYNYNRSDSLDPLERLDDDWRHVETFGNFEHLNAKEPGLEVIGNSTQKMLNCILGMVDKTKRALAVLQERSLRDREELSVWMRRQAEGLDHDVKKHTNDMMAFTVRQTEDRVTEVRRRAEAVNEVKRQAMLELQKAVTAAESKASEMVMSERVKMERMLQQARCQTREEVMGAVNHQEESSESCWNCGRKASETCSGCNMARYCGSFCQHKDWENHHLVCGKQQVTSIAQARDHRRALLAASSSAATSSAPATITTSSLSSVPSSSAPSGPAPATTPIGSAPAMTAAKEMPSTTTTTATSSSSPSSSSPPTQTTPPPTLALSGSDVTATSAVSGSSEAKAASPAASDSDKSARVSDSPR
ncbi:protein CBFA2T1-like isoform X2 [Littorina saxatilis]|uniref:protein CBFA2T1-like isoform X2 n=1 Tax=Littorina saxatilis TaxID=31220 RepID=UPI0038B56DF4